MSFDKIHKEHLDTNLQQIKLCSEVIEDLIPKVIDPISADGKADLLLATEDLTIEVARLYKKVYELVWQESPKMNQQDNQTES